MARTKGRKNDGRASDLTFKWMLTTLGPEWEQWQELAAEWMATQHSGIDDKRKALSVFFESYLLECAPYAVDVGLFFKGITVTTALVKSLKLGLEKALTPPIESQMLSITPVTSLITSLSIIYLKRTIVAT